MQALTNIQYELFMVLGTAGTSKCVALMSLLQQHSKPLDHMTEVF